MLDNPIKKDENLRALATAYIFKWMSGTPDHSFVFGDELNAIVKSEKMILPILIAAMAKTALETPDKKETDVLTAAALRTAMSYCSNKKNGLKAPKALKKAAKV